MRRLFSLNNFFSLVYLEWKVLTSKMMPLSTERKRKREDVNLLMSLEMNVKCTCLTRTLANLSDKWTPLNKIALWGSKYFTSIKLLQDLFSLVWIAKYCNPKSDIYKIYSLFETEVHAILFLSFGWEHAGYFGSKWN